MSLVEERTRPAAERVAPVHRELEAGRPDYPATSETKQPRYRRVLIGGAVLVLVLVIAAAIGGVAWWLDARNWVSTDDAFIQVHMVHRSAHRSLAASRTFSSTTTRRSAPASRS